MKNRIQNRPLFLFLLLVSICLVKITEISVADSAGGNVRGRNYNSFTITGNGATDMIACYQAQLNRKGRDIGFASGWCDTILVDCAILTNQTDAIGTPVLSNMRSEIETRGGIPINDINDIQAGDIIFFSGHVALASDKGHSYHGNIGSSTERPLDSNVRYLCTFGYNTYGCNDTTGYSGGSYQGAIRPVYKNKLVDTVKPTLTEYRIENITSTSYEVYLRGSDNLSQKLKFKIGTWNDNMLIDDAKWQTSEYLSSKEVRFTVKISDFGNVRGFTYHTNAYVIDESGNTSNALRVGDPYIERIIGIYPVTG